MEMGEEGGDRGGGQVIAIASSLVGGALDAVEMAVVSSYGYGERVGVDVCDGVVGLEEHQRRLCLSMGG